MLGFIAVIVLVFFVIGLFKPNSGERPMDNSPPPGQLREDHLMTQDTLSNKSATTGSWDDGSNDVS